MFLKYAIHVSNFRPIAETNKGHKLLAKMGWKEGQGLGRDEQGLSEPVSEDQALLMNLYITYVYRY